MAVERRCSLVSYVASLFSDRIYVRLMQTISNHLKRILKLRYQEHLLTHLKPEGI